MSTATPDPRLPEGVAPRHYEIDLSPDLEAAAFTGSVTIDVEIAAARSTITLNAAELRIDSAQLVGEDGATSELDHELDAASERLTLRRRGGRRFVQGPAKLRISFDGILNDRLRGFYLSTYRDDAGAVHALAATQFESTDARRAFPCFDEPALKATFAASLTVRQGLLAVSNTAEIRREPLADGRVRVGFATTMVMSTYLVAFVVGPLEATEPIDCDGVPVRVIHRPGRGGQTGFALDVAAHALSWFVDYYDLPYPSDKVDLVAIPDFAFGAMENLGCVTFREVLLLVDPDSASQSDLRRAATVINHELAHMWFGDLVTMAWWEGIWLNEAFATFMETACSDAYRPDWHVWTEFCRGRASAFATDALASTRPVEYPVCSPAEAEGMFDVITYEKGAALLRMLEQYLGEEAFRAGVRLYLRRHAHGNTVTADLWNALAEASGQPVGRIMHDWIHQGGYPAVSSVACDHGVTLSQRHFTLDPRHSDERLWPVPLRLRVTAADGRSREHRLLLDAPSRTLTFVAGAATVALNSGASGFYRRDLNAEALADASEARVRQLSPEERHGLADDAWAATLSGGLAASDFLDLIVRGFRREQDLTVWQALAAALAHLSRLVSGDARKSFRGLVLAVSEHAAGETGLDPRPGENDRVRELRAALLTLRGAVGDDDASVAAARRRLDHDDPTLAAAALSVVAAHGDSSDFALVRERFETASDPQTEQRNLFALADFRDPQLVGRILAGTLEGTVRTQDSPYLIRRALSNAACADEAWGFLRERWDQLLAVLPANHAWARMLEGVTALDEPATADEVKAFLAAHPPPAGAQQLAQHLERLDVNVALRTRESHRLSRRLATLGAS